MRIEWDNNVPAEVRGAVEPLIDRYLWLLPPWVEQLGLFWREGDGDASAATTHWNHKYRWGRIVFHPIFLTGDEASRELWVIHELLHLTTGEMVLFVDNMLDRLRESVEPEWAADTLDEVWTGYVESATEDLAQAIYRRPRVEGGVSRLATPGSGDPHRPFGGGGTAGA